MDCSDKLSQRHLSVGRGGHSSFALTALPRTLLPNILKVRAAEQVERLACRFVFAGPGESTSGLNSASTIRDSGETLPSTDWRYQELSYSELHRQASRVAKVLRISLGNVVGTSDAIGSDAIISPEVPSPRVLLAYSPGLPFVAALLGCWYAGVVPVPVQPARRHQRKERWLHILKDAEAAGILTCNDHVAEIRSVVFSQSADDSKDVFLIATDTVEFESQSLSLEDFNLAAISGDSLALLQYTSGSTGQPKGVMVSHANLMHNLATIHQRFGHGANSHGVIWLPPHHDMGLIGGILQPIYSGFSVTLMSPELFLRQPILWLQAISDFRGTTSGGPNFAYEYCLQKTTPEQRRGLDLSCWQVAFTGAEPVRAKTLSAFAAAFADCGFQASAFYPCYGLAESTLFAAGGAHDVAPVIRTLDRERFQQHQVLERIEGRDGISVVGCGISAEELLIVNLETRKPCSPEQIGEIWLAGPSVARGYWQKSTATEETFKACLADGGGPYLRTGDLGFHDGQQLYVTGRLKDLLVIRGQNHYPQDIEQTVAQSHEDLRPWGAAFSIERDFQERLVVFQEVRRTALLSVDAPAMVEAIRAAISQRHGLQVADIWLLKPGQIPQTTSGKVQRHACKAAFENRTLQPIAQWSFADQPAPEQPAPEQSASDQSASEQPAPEQQILNQAMVQRHQALDAPEPESKSERLIQWLRDYAKTSINSRMMDERRCLSPGVVLDFGNQGLLGMQVPAQYDGLGLGHRETIRVLEQLGAIDPTLALFVGLNNVLGIRPILRSAQPALQARLLPQLATGRILAAFALTEPGAGSHPLGTSAKAIPNGTGWRLTGHKIWSGSAAWAGVINVFVQQQSADGIPLGMTGFVLEKGISGLRQGPEALTMGMRGMVQNTVFLEDVPVQASQRLGVPGAGMAVAQDAMMYGRLAIASASIGGMKRCAQLMLRYSQRRTVATGRLLDNPVTQTRLGWLTHAIAALSSLVSWIAQRLDDGQPVPEELYAACKIIGPELYWQAADSLVQNLGGRGYIETNLAPQILRDARILRIFEGPTEALALYLGARILHQPAAVNQLLIHLNLAPLADELFTAAERIGHYYASAQSPFTENVAARRQTHFAVGMVTAWALVRATLTATGATDREVGWAKLQFEQSVSQALSGGAVPSSVDLIQQIQAYRADIGEVDQTLAGVDEALDDWLQPKLMATQPLAHGTQPKIQQQETLPQSVLQQADSQQTGFQQAGSQPKGRLHQQKRVEQWLVQWLARRLRVSLEQVEPSKALADYGVDSVMAVELAQDLEDFLSLEQPLDVTLAWNFPTLSALSHHLASLVVSPVNPGVSGPAAAEQISSSVAHSAPLLDVATPPEEENFDLLSDAEIAEALAAELATVRGRGT
ncbi:MAG: AMP-binding protein [Cyanobacteria bacterium P01_A01_bin.105]